MGANVTLGMDDVMPFGKHKDMTVNWVVDNDPKYLQWWDETIDQYPIDDYIIKEIREQEERKYR